MIERLGSMDQCVVRVRDGDEEIVFSLDEYQFDVDFIKYGSGAAVREEGDLLLIPKGSPQRFDAVE
jgi:hypothetical protein